MTGYELLLACTMGLTPCTMTPIKATLPDAVIAYCPKEWTIGQKGKVMEYVEIPLGENQSVHVILGCPEQT